MALALAVLACSVDRGALLRVRVRMRVGMPLTARMEVLNL
ncbi:hypothetical protein HMPREF1549_01989 [Actinomyces johnsonii F0510]|uniref:Uncharacterized protein n=1 Tax=Actinomyces johnsonii F0510 TaxID=1227262 RepID=U1RET0_9ACTO|nr:hypothetical protein HMPREF1549_01989 [Actinomyces johnsonii F0510]